MFIKATKGDVVTDAKAIYQSTVLGIPVAVERHRAGLQFNEIQLLHCMFAFLFSLNRK